MQRTAHNGGILITPGYVTGDGEPICKRDRKARHVTETVKG